MNPDIVGWGSTAILILTVGRQAFTQWKTQSSEGVSRWLFIGQMVTSAGFVVYSVLLGNLVFEVSNAFLLVIAAIGQWLLVRNRKKEAGLASGTGRADPPSSAVAANMERTVL